MSSYAHCVSGIVAALLLLQPVGAGAQANPPPPSDAVALAMENGRRLTGLRTVADCRAEAAATGDIVVCGRMEDHSLPVPELIGPPRIVAGADVPGVLDEPCGISGCYVGVDLPKLIGAGIGIAQLLLDPDRNLGEGDPIPQRFRGANR